MATAGSRSAAWVVAQRAADQRSLLLRYDGAWTVVREETTPELTGVRLVDVAGTDGSDLWVLATKGPDTLAPEPLLFHHDGDAWQRHPLWRWTRPSSLAVDAERGQLWLDTIALPIAELPLSPDSQPGTAVFAGASTPFSHRGLWIGRDEVWLTNGDQAVHRRR